MKNLKCRDPKEAVLRLRKIRPTQVVFGKHVFVGDNVLEIDKMKADQRLARIS